MKIDLIIDNANLLTMEATRPRATRIGIHRDRVMGLDEDLHGVTASERIDAGGATITPGFNDAHAHSVWFGLTLIETSLASARSLTDVYDRIGDAAAADEGGDWIVAAGLNHLLIGGAYPDRDALDRASGGRPVWIKHSSGHACILNGVALRRVGIPERDPMTIPGGRVVVDRSGRPTGVLEENAMQLVRDVMLPYPLHSIEAALASATAHYVTEGITSVTDAGIAGGYIGHSPDEFTAYQNARDAGSLRSRMQVMLSIDALSSVTHQGDDSPGTRATAGIRSGLGDEWLQIGPAKMFIDGSMLASTAYMSEEYTTCCGHGYLQGEPELLRAQAVGAQRAGWALALHAIGDGGLDFALDVLTEAQAVSGPRKLPNRIEHGGVIRPNQLTRLAASGVAVVPQAHFIAEFGDGMAELLGAQRSDWCYRAASLLDAGITLPGSSDRPVAPGAPLAVIQSFVERRTESGAVLGPGERISASAALAAYTKGSAKATGWSHDKGVLAPGMLADLVVLGADPTAVPASEISKIEVLATMIGGAFAHGTNALSIDAA